MRIILILMAFAIGCGDDKAKATDAPSGGDAPGLIDAAPLTLDCASYCGAILTTCTGALAQYGSMAECVGACGTLPVGTLGEMSGNTLGCRVYHTEAARQDAAVHCEHAGPGGNSLCGATICDGFCSIAVAICPAQWQNATCANRCGQLTSTPPYSIASTGDTVQCRLYHATAASADAAAATLHCPHTDRMNSATCQ